jgi:hypothetical protein
MANLIIEVPDDLVRSLEGIATAQRLTWNRPSRVPRMLKTSMPQ